MKRRRQRMMRRKNWITQIKILIRITRILQIIKKPRTRQRRICDKAKADKAAADQNVRIFRMPSTSLTREASVSRAAAAVAVKTFRRSGRQGKKAGVAPRLPPGNDTARERPKTPEELKKEMKCWNKRPENNYAGDGNEPGWAE